ncbi:uncharacterized protein CTRU02_209952 [Colletotrichum truncatum]|uniref:Uncharacterized protein n=1 Tax=Colletotrichum truncatum TaxID=5467 RepID=A0ACC3YV69_COLTU|nr:uncharacterized protein CTRU02_02524 [Colletotrichum truncatum]KAF6798550.1 hypothetical protein CTRU02_02524 [Colletotrichum truncatum]
MQLYAILTAAATVFSLSAMVQARPLPCPDLKRDLILSGQASPEICCSYGTCKGDVNIISG